MAHQAKAELIDTELFEQWFSHFIMYTPFARSLLLLLDGHTGRPITNCL